MRFAVLEDGECAFIEVRNHALLVIHDGGVQHYLVHFFFENEDTTLIAFGRLSCLGRRSTRRCGLLALLRG